MIPHGGIRYMFTFKEEHDLAAFDAFLEAHGGHYIQCSRWQTVKTTWKCRYISGFDGDERVLAVLIMERLLPAAGKIWYGSGGPVCDYGNTALLEAFTAFIRAEVKANGVTAFIMDPPVSLRINGETQEQGVALHKTLTDMGYVLNGNLTNYTYKQPVQLFIPLK